ncbi:UV-stimulated scaffold protein A homolog [Chenopodium quinoa]|uniref:UV-stimulated scaffold protein A C-terminal domain-containing protein n=1 Tax=Chenopodium quinoa TaxID=63459 RepID=A0A803M4T0_CHEQI|nr:UV-stimulated scaffold protein A homolog [Chenopodium quinoa]
MAEDHEQEERETGKAVALIEKATNSTEPGVDPRLLKAIKTIVRYSDFELKLAHKTLIHLMKRQHSQIRYLALLIIDELFMRSKLFRTLITENLDQLLSLSVGFRRNQPLPAPSSVASVLRAKAIEFLEKWNSSFGIHYRQLRLGYDYLKNTLRYQFPNLQANAARIERERREREVRTQVILKNKLKTLRERLPSLKEEIRLTIDEIGECLEIARANDENAALEPLDDDEEEFEGMRNPELMQLRLDALKEAEKVHENSDNKVVFDALRELYKLLVKKHLVSVQEWISVLIRVEVDDVRFRDSALKEFIDVRNRITAVKKKCEESGCALPKIRESEEDDDIWEECIIESVEGSKDLNVVPVDRKVLTTDASERPECSKSGAKKKDVVKRRVSAVDSNPLRGKLLAEAPVVNWGSSLDNWGEKRDVLANQRGLEIDGHWSRVDSDAAIPSEKIAELNVHASLYKEEQAEVQPCRAPLRNGKLCQRKDLRVCPFHGPVIPRDDKGKPIYSEDDAGKSAISLGDEGTSMRQNSSTEELNIDGLGISSEQLAKMAVKNVREKDEEEIKRKESDKRAIKKAKLAKVREYNDAVLREAAIASTSSSAAFGEVVPANTGERSTKKIKGPTLASMLRKKVTAKDRLAQKLLSSRAKDETVKQLTKGEDTRYRESFPNQW